MSGANGSSASRSGEPSERVRLLPEQEDTKPISFESQPSGGPPLIKCPRLSFSADFNFATRIPYLNVDMGAVGAYSRSDHIGDFQFVSPSGKYWAGGFCKPRQVADGSDHHHDHDDHHGHHDDHDHDHQHEVHVVLWDADSGKQVKDVDVTCGYGYDDLECCEGVCGKVACNKNTFLSARTRTRSQRSQEETDIAIVGWDMESGETWRKLDLVKHALADRGRELDPDKTVVLSESFSPGGVYFIVCGYGTMSNAQDASAAPAPHDFLLVFDATDRLLPVVLFEAIPDSEDRSVFVPPEADPEDPHVAQHWPKLYKEVSMCPQDRALYWPKGRLLWPDVLAHSKQSHSVEMPCEDSVWSADGTKLATWINTDTHSSNTPKIVVNDVSIWDVGETEFKGSAGEPMAKLEVQTVCGQEDMKFFSPYYKGFTSNCCFVDHNGKLELLTFSDGQQNTIVQVVVWDLETCQPVSEVQLPKAYKKGSVVLPQSGQWLGIPTISGNENGLCLYDVYSGNELAEIKLGTSCKFVVDRFGGRIAAEGPDGSRRVWHVGGMIPVVDKCHPQHAISLPLADKALKKRVPHSCKLSNDGSKLGVSYLGTDHWSVVQVWDLDGGSHCVIQVARVQDGRCELGYEPHSKGRPHMGDGGQNLPVFEFSPDNSKVVICDLTGTVNMWRLEHGRAELEFTVARVPLNGARPVGICFVNSQVHHMCVSDAMGNLHSMQGATVLCRPEVAARVPACFVKFVHGNTKALVGWEVEGEGEGGYSIRVDQWDLLTSAPQPSKQILISSVWADRKRWILIRKDGDTYQWEFDRTFQLPDEEPIDEEMFFTIKQLISFGSRGSRFSVWPMCPLPFSNTSREFTWVNFGKSQPIPYFDIAVYIEPSPLPDKGENYFTFQRIKEVDIDEEFEDWVEAKTEWAVSGNGPKTSKCDLRSVHHLHHIKRGFRKGHEVLIPILNDANVSTIFKDIQSSSAWMDMSACSADGSRIALVDLNEQRVPRIAVWTPYASFTANETGVDGRTFDSANWDFKLSKMVNNKSGTADLEGLVNIFGRGALNRPLVSKGRSMFLNKVPQELDHLNDYSIFLRAVKSENITLCTQILEFAQEEGITLNFKRKNATGVYENALEMAVENGSPEMVSILLRFLLEGVGRRAQLSDLLSEELVGLLQTTGQKGGNTNFRHLCIDVLQSKSVMMPIGEVDVPYDVFAEGSFLYGVSNLCHCPSKDEIPQESVLLDFCSSIFDPLRDLTETEYKNSVKAKGVLYIVPYSNIAQPGRKGILRPLQILGAPDDLFAQIPVQGVILWKWSAYAQRSALKDSLLYVLLIILFSVFSVIMAYHHPLPVSIWKALTSSSHHYSWWMVVSLLSVMALTGYTILREIAQVMVFCRGANTGKSNWFMQIMTGIQHWLSSRWNVLELATYILLLLVIPVLFFAEHWSLYACVAVTNVFVWWKVLYYMQMFPQTAPLVIMIFEIMKDMLSFLLLAVFLWFGFGVAFYALYNPCRVCLCPDGVDQDCSDETKSCDASDSGTIVTVKDCNPDLVDAFGNLWLSLITVFSMLLGDFDSALFTGSGFSALAVLLFVFYELIMMIVLMNLLIAIMNDSFDRIKQRELTAFLVAKADMVDDAECMTFDNPPVAIEKYFYILAAKTVVDSETLEINLEEAGDGDDNAWMGRIVDMERKLRRVVLEGITEMRAESKKCLEDFSNAINRR